MWEENFDQAEHFDEASWSKIPRGRSDWNNYMSDFDSCYAMRDGNLVLRGLVNYSLPVDTAPFITGGVYTKGKVGFSDGRLDIRAKLYGATGAWPAFWLLPENEGWPDGGEIDIMERLNNDTIAYQTVHSAYTHVLGIQVIRSREEPGRLTATTIMSTAWKCIGTVSSFLSTIPAHLLIPVSKLTRKDSSRSQTKSFICCSICS